MAARPLAASAAAIAEPTPPVPTTRQRVPAQAHTLALGAANKARAVEEITEQRSVGPAQDRIAGTGDAHGGGALLHEADGRHLVRHGHERAADIGELEYGFQRRRIVGAAHTHGHDHGVDAGAVEIGVVDHRRLDRCNGVAEMRNQTSWCRGSRPAPAIIHKQGMHRCHSFSSHVRLSNYCAIHEQITIRPCLRVKCDHRKTVRLSTINSYGLVPRTAITLRHYYCAGNRGACDCRSQGPQLHHPGSSEIPAALDVGREVWLNVN